jgi:tetratricopeptide (TPR) repeat protein
MEPKSPKEVDQRVKGFYTKAQEAARQNNLEYSIEMYNTALKHCPEFREARQELRKVELSKINHKPSGARQAWIATKSAIVLNVKGPSLIKKEKYGEALQMAESVLAKDPTVGPALKLVAKAAEEADMEWLSIDTLEFMLKYHPKDISGLKWLFELYLDNGEGDKAASVVRRIIKLDPDNGAYDTMLKNAMARSAMDKSTWMDDEKKAATQAGTGTAAPGRKTTVGPAQDEVARDEDTAQALITKYEEMINGGQDSIDNRKRLARALMKVNRFDDAIEHLQHAIEVGGQVDPSLQNMVYTAAEGRFDAAIKAWVEYGEKGNEEGAQASQEIAKLDIQKSDFLLQKARDRAELYSNDANVHMELAMILWQRQEVDEALVEFQKAQGSPRHRKSATLHKAKCFAIKKQYDIAIKEFESLLAEIPDMNKEKLDVIYEKASVLKEMGRDEESIETFKIIYEEDVSYRDVKEIMDEFYKK